ncbi:hypothetical protein ANO11243_025690 [Dothideomycetidae sp. 11243]|nr:hypothetical protein ANO11243_025690 [fungal sp. No.11243]
MSTAKRSRQRQPDQAAVTSLPPAKRAKVAKDASTSSPGLGFLTDERQRAGKIIQAKTTNGVDNARFSRADESKAVISGQDVANDDEENADSDDASVVSTSSEDPSSVGDNEEDDIADVLMTNGNGGPVVLDIQGDDAETEPMDVSLPNGSTETHDAEENDDLQPSFGEMLQSVHPNMIEVTSGFDESELRSKSLVPAEGSKVLQAPSGASLGTVLSQALRTNDKELLESCLQTKDTATIKSTIQRLQSPLIATLMQKLAERLHKRPGRAGPLMVWVQWSLVAHGGYLAGQPQVVRKLRSLRQVVRERAGSLQSLITLKGKLDLLSAQVELRRSIRAQNVDPDDSDDSENDVIYVEGEEVESSSDEGSDDDLRLIKQRPQTVRSGSGVVASMADEMDGDIPLINGVDEDAEMESLVDEDEDEEGETGGFIDDEAEESEGGESISSEEEESDSASDAEGDDQEDDDSSSEDEGPASSRTRSSQAGKRASLVRKR